MSLFIESKINHVWSLVDGLRKAKRRGRIFALVALPAESNPELFSGVELSPILKSCISDQGMLVLKIGEKSCPSLTIDKDGIIEGHTAVNHTPVSFKIPAWYIQGVDSDGEVATFDTYLPSDAAEKLKNPNQESAQEQKPKRPTLTVVK